MTTKTKYRLGGLSAQEIRTFAISCQCSAMNMRLGMVAPTSFAVSRKFENMASQKRALQIQ